MGSQMARIEPKASSGPGHGTWKRTRNTDKDTEQEHGSGAGAKAELKPKLTLHKGVWGVLLCPRVCVSVYVCALQASAVCRGLSAIPLTTTTWLNLIFDSISTTNTHGSSLSLSFSLSLYSLCIFFLSLSLSWLFFRLWSCLCPRGWQSQAEAKNQSSRVKAKKDALKMLQPTMGPGPASGWAWHGWVWRAAAAAIGDTRSRLCLVNLATPLAYTRLHRTRTGTPSRLSTRLDFWPWHQEASPQ